LNKIYTPDHPDVVRAHDLYAGIGIKTQVAKEMDISVAKAHRLLAVDTQRKETEFETPILPDELPSAEELLERRKHQYALKDRAEEARKLIQIKVKIDGPIGILHMGDPHVDDNGTDISAIERHVGLINSTPGLFGGNVGDSQNNWVGRLAHLFGEQSLSAAEAWVLTEWLINGVEWLYLIGGNHDVWSGAGDPLKWMTRSQVGVFEDWGARLSLKFPNDKDVRINARHDFVGHSQWNAGHGPTKAAMMGWKDHVLIAGHKHTSAYNVVKDPASGLISHAMRVAGYKIHDRYAKQLGLPNQNISPAFVTVIDPEYADDDPRLISTFFSPEEGAEYLTWKRKKK